MTVYLPRQHRQALTSDAACMSYFILISYYARQVNFVMRLNSRRGQQDSHNIIIFRENSKGFAKNVPQVFESLTFSKARVFLEKAISRNFISKACPLKSLSFLTTTST
mmetsp:Transcript_2360/g.3399  ORF Transcript_2360/g.3399 Transcript_2360/m.3399 type:complete len:108 (+) Transcript_2360:90-413(+)